MSLLRDPIKVLDQIEWYLDNQQMEKFPGAFICGAGNLSRQLLEQILFVISYYSELPPNKFIKSNNQLRSLDFIWKSLKAINPKTNKKYIERARLGNPRIKKFVKLSSSINK